jgi:GrpB-like predicted nucleotidyltransferase (UPF0157 family)
MTVERDPQLENAKVPEQQFRTIIVGKVSSSNKIIRLEPSNPEWPSMFASLESQIRDSLGAKALMIEHVGSTAVAGLSAKPIIDVALVVSNSTEESSYVPPLENAGYTLALREPDWFEHRLMKSPSIDGNIHVFTHGCEEINRMLAFRDWLRINDEDRKRYERTKQKLATRSWEDMQNYANAKSDLVRTILANAGWRLR